MFFLPGWLLWPVVAPVLVIVCRGKDHFSRGVVMKFWILGLILAGAVCFLWQVTDFTPAALAFAACYVWYGREMYKIAEEQGMKIFG